jgi:hypothetical protein
MSILWHWKSSRHTLDSRQGIVLPDPPDPPTPEPETLTLELAVPSNTEVVSGDLLVALISTDANPTLTSPAGWSIEDQIGGSAKSYVDLRLSTGSEPASYTWTLDGAEDAVGAILWLKRVHATEYVDAKILDSGTASTITVPSITTTVARTMLVTLISMNDGVLIDTTTLPRKQTTLWTVATSGQAIGSVGSNAGYETVKKAGATGTYNFDTVGDVSTDYYIIRIAFAPLGSDPVPGPADDAILLETDDFLLLETDDYILLE